MLEERISDRFQSHKGHSRLLSMIDSNLCQLHHNHTQLLVSHRT
jgi:hypothetical protein